MNNQQAFAESRYWKRLALALGVPWRLYGFGNERSATFIADEKRVVNVEPDVHDALVSALGENAPKIPKHWRAKR